LFKEELSVPDQDVLQKRLLMQKTAEFHKKMNDFRPNAIFSSSVVRSTTLDKGLKPVLDYDFFNKTGSSFAIGSSNPNSTK